MALDWSVIFKIVTICMFEIEINCAAGYLRGAIMIIIMTKMVSKIMKMMMMTMVHENDDDDEAGC